MKTEIKSSAAVLDSTEFPCEEIRRAHLEFGEGFRRFLMAFPAEEDEPKPSTSGGPPQVRQPLRFLEATPTTEDARELSRSRTAMLAVQEALSNGLSAAILLAAQGAVR